MLMLPESLIREVNESLLRFLWRQWSQIGVAGELAFHDRWAIDPEALLAFTLLGGRHDARLFDEVLDWAVRNGRLLSVQRLKNVTEAFADEDVRRTISAFSTIVDGRDTKPRWSKLALGSPSTAGTPEPFFIDLDNKPMPLVGDLDESFLRVGYARARVQLRGMSRPIPVSTATNLIFRLRSIFGLGPRAEVLAYLLTRSVGQASEIARATNYSRTQVQETLTGFVQAEVAFERAKGQKRLYGAEADQWLALLDIHADLLPTWIDWTRVFSAVLALTSFLQKTTAEPASDYLLKSDILTLSNRLRETLTDTGIENPFEKPLGLDESAELFEPRARFLVNELATGGLPDHH